MNLTAINKEMWRQGRDYWMQYIRLNGYDFEPKRTGIEKLSRDLDINKGHLQRCINVYLES